MLESTDDLFAPINLNARGQEKIQAAREHFTTLIKELEKFNLDGKEWSIVAIKLQEASFYTTRALSLQPGNQE